MPLSTKSKWGLAAGGAAIAAAIVYSIVKPAAFPPVPGYWHQGSLLVPCATVKAYDPWVSPADGKTYVLRYDYTAMFQSGGTLPRDADYGAGNHTKQSYLLDGYIHPIQPQPDVDNYYPAPTLEMGCVMDIHGTSWSAYNTSPCPIASLAAYQSKIGSTGVWQSGVNLYAAQRQQECSAPAPTVTPSIPRTPTVGPKPTCTPCGCVITQ